MAQRMPETDYRPACHALHAQNAALTAVTQTFQLHCRHNHQPSTVCRHVWTATPETLSGPACHMESSCAWSVVGGTGAWECTSALCGEPPTLQETAAEVRCIHLWLNVSLSCPSLAHTALHACSRKAPLCRSVSMDAWSPDQLKKMHLGGNDVVNNFLKQYGIDKYTDIKEKYNSQAAEVSERRGDLLDVVIAFGV